MLRGLKEPVVLLRDRINRAFQGAKQKNSHHLLFVNTLLVFWREQAKPQFFELIWVDFGGCIG
jgi:hypothetical protein